MDLPFSVSIGGKKIEQKFPVGYIDVFQGVNEIPYSIIKIHEFTNLKDDLFLDDSIFEIGAKVEISAQNNNKLEVVFSGILMNISLSINNEIGENFIELKCFSNVFKMNIAKKSSCFLNKSDADILKSIVSSYGLSASVGSMAIKHEFIYQNNLTDWEFINIRADLYGYVVSVEGDKVVIDKPKKNTSSSVANLENIVSSNLELDSCSQISSFEAKIWDIKDQSCKPVKSDTGNENSFGSKKSSDIVSKSGNQVGNLLSDSFKEDEIKGVLNGTIGLNRYYKIHGYLVLLNNVSLKHNSLLKIDKCGKIFNGNGYVSSVQYSYSTGDPCWTSKVFLGIPKNKIVEKNVCSFKNSKIISFINNLRYGKVLKIDGDPSSNYRVFVNLPTINNNGEGVWCRISSLYSSINGGVLFLPEKGDEVVVGFIDGNTSSPIVLGSIYNSKTKPPVDIKAENDLKVIKTNAGLEINFNDKDKIIGIKTCDKRSIIISEKDQEIKINDDGNTISLNKGSIKIKASKDLSIDCKDINIKASGNVKISGVNNTSVEGNNVKINGSIGVNIKGGTSSKIESSGITEVKGSMVKIN